MELCCITIKFMKLVKKNFKLEKELKLNNLVCAIVKTIGLLVGIVLFACFMSWLVTNVSFSTVMNFFLVVMLIWCVAFIFVNIYESCEKSNQQTAKKTTTNANQTVKNTTPVQSKTEPVTYSTHSQQNNTSEQFDVKPTKQYPVLGEIQKIISNLTELEKKQDLDKDLFIQFHTLEKQFNSDYQEIVKMLNTLEEIDQLDNNHLESFKKYLDVFKKQQQIIYDNIKQQYNDKLNTINEQLQHFN